VLPVRGSPQAAGYDLAAAYDTVIPAGGKGIVKTDLGECSSMFHILLLNAHFSEFDPTYFLLSTHRSLACTHNKCLTAIALPDGVYGRIAPRSGLAWKKHIDVGAGVIDQVGSITLAFVIHYLPCLLLSSTHFLFIPFFVPHLTLQDYRGNVGVVLFNHGKNDLELKAGDRCAQLILERYEVAVSSASALMMTFICCVLCTLRTPISRSICIFAHPATGRRGDGRAGRDAARRWRLWLDRREEVENGRREGINEWTWKWKWKSPTRCVREGVSVVKNG
jgi:dUTPase